MSPAVKTPIVLGRCTRRAPAPEASKKQVIPEASKRQITTEKNARRTSSAQCKEGSHGKPRMGSQEDDYQQQRRTRQDEGGEKETGVGSQIEAGGTTQTSGMEGLPENSADMQPQVKLSRLRQSQIELRIEADRSRHPMNHLGQSQEEVNIEPVTNRRPSRNRRPPDYLKCYER